MSFTFLRRRRHRSNSRGVSAFCEPPERIEQALARALLLIPGYRGFAKSAHPRLLATTPSGFIGNFAKHSCDVVDLW
jgi:hypothetical protein